MVKIPATEFHKLKPGTVFLFENPVLKKKEQGKLLYAQTARKDLRDKKKNLTGKTVLVAYRCGYVPVPERSSQWSDGDEKLKVYEVHICCGQFIIHRV
jgi:hypothetical protein